MAKLLVIMVFTVAVAIIPIIIITDITVAMFYRRQSIKRRQAEHKVYNYFPLIYFLDNIHSLRLPKFSNVKKLEIDQDEGRTASSAGTKLPFFGKKYV